MLFKYGLYINSSSIYNQNEKLNDCKASSQRSCAEAVQKTKKAKLFNSVFIRSAAAQDQDKNTL